MKSIQHSGITLLVIAGLSACGGGGGSGGSSSNDPPPPPPINQSAGGIWTVQYVEPSGPNAGDQIDGKALITEAGDVFFAGINTVNGCAEIGFGQVSVSGSSVSGVNERRGCNLLAESVRQYDLYVPGWLDKRHDLSQRHGLGAFEPEHYRQHHDLNGHGARW